MKFRKMMGCIALGLTCAMIGAGATMAAQNTPAAAEAVTAANSTTTVVTSPFTAAVQQVRNSVVGVSNYQTVRYGSYGNNFYFGYGFGYGNGRNNDQQIEEREELAATGSGVVIGQGFVLTNYHVVEDASSLRVTVTDDSGNTDEYAATLVAYDESLDIAIVYAIATGGHAGRQRHPAGRRLGNQHRQPAGLHQDHDGRRRQRPEPRD